MLLWHKYKKRMLNDIKKHGMGEVVGSDGNDIMKLLDSKIFLIEETDETVHIRDKLRADQEKLIKLSRNLPYELMVIETHITNDYHDPDETIKTGARSFCVVQQFDSSNDERIISIQQFNKVNGKITNSGFSINAFPDTYRRLDPRLSETGCYMQVSIVDMLEQSDRTEELSSENKSMFMLLALDVLASVAHINDCGVHNLVKRRPIVSGNNKVANIIKGDDYHVVRLLNKESQVLGFRDSNRGAVREHDVRGHWRNLSNGKSVWVRSHKRGDSSLGKVHNGYLIEDQF